VPTYKLQLVAGRNLQPSGWTREFLVNESFVKSLGLKKPEDILNKDIGLWDDRMKGPVVGVLKDFNDRSFRHHLAPLIITTNNTMYDQAAVRAVMAASPLPKLPDEWTGGAVLRLHISFDLARR